MTAVEAAAHLSALMVMILRLGRTALPVLRLSNHPAAIAVCVFLPLLPSVIESLGGVATSLELADALLLAAVNGVGAWRGREATTAIATVALAWVCWHASACTPLQAERAITEAAQRKPGACEVYCAIRPELNTPENEREQAARNMADAACALECLE
jgi:hypothetical protein